MSSVTMRCVRRRNMKTSVGFAADNDILPASAAIMDQITSSSVGYLHYVALYLPCLLLRNIWQRVRERQQQPKKEG